MSDVVGCCVIALAGASLAINHEAILGYVRPLYSAPQGSQTAAPQPKVAVAAEPRRADGTVEFKADSGGHFSVEARINGRPVTVLVDTGATLVALSAEDAERAGIFVRPHEFTHRVSTANGVAKVAPVELDSITIGDIRVRNVRGVVLEQGAMRGTLLGMSFLSKLNNVQMQNGRLILKE